MNGLTERDEDGAYKGMLRHHSACTYLSISVSTTAGACAYVATCFWYVLTRSRADATNDGIADGQRWSSVVSKVVAADSVAREAGRHGWSHFTRDSAGHCQRSPALATSTRARKGNNSGLIAYDQYDGRLSHSHAKL